MLASWALMSKWSKRIDAERNAAQAREEAEQEKTQNPLSLTGSIVTHFSQNHFVALRTSALHWCSLHKVSCFNNVVVMMHNCNGVCVVLNMATLRISHSWRWYTIAWRRSTIAWRRSTIRRRWRTISRRRSTIAWRWSTIPRRWRTISRRWCTYWVTLWWCLISWRWAAICRRWISWLHFKLQY